MLNIRKFLLGLGIKPKPTTQIDSQGEMEVLSSDGKLHYHNGTSASPMVTEAHASTLTNKSIDADTNTITNIDNNEIKALAAIDATKIADGSVSNTEFQYLDGASSNLQAQITAISGSGITSLTGDVVGTGPGATATQIAANVIVDGDINASAAIARSKLAAGTANSVVVNNGSGVMTDAAAITANRAVVSDANGIPTQSATTDTEIGFVSGVTSSIQTQLGNKQPLDATLTALAAYNTNGIVTQTAADTFTGRTVTGTANQISVTNGDGVAGNPTLAIASNPIIPGTADIQIPAGTTAQRPGSPAAGMLRLNSDTNQFEGYTTAWGAIAGSGGSINYVSPNDGSSTTGYATYADAAGTAPVDGTGGSPTVTFATSTDSSLVGTANYLYTKPASNVQGQGWSYDFTIDQAFQSKPMTLSFLYKVASGTYTDGDMTCWIYDKTNSVLIQPSAYTILNSTIAATQKCEFQASSNSTSYRLIVHTSGTSAAAATIRFDQISIAPNTYNAGASISDWVSFTPTGTWTSNTTYTGQYRRVGSNLEMQVKLALTGAPTSASLFVNLPSGLSIDSNKILSSVAGEGNFGTCYARASAGNAKVIGKISYGTSTSVVLYGQNGVGNITAATEYVSITQASPITFANGDVIYSNFTVPIAGWGVNQVLSSDTDTRVVAAFANNIAGGAYTGGNVFPFTNVITDTHGGFSAGTYTIRVPGIYQVSAPIYNNPLLANIASIRKNGTIVANAYTPQRNDTAANATMTPTAIISCNTGDTITVTLLTSMTLDASSQEYSISINRLSGPAQIAASESVNASYWSSGNTSMSTTVPLNADQRYYDSHNAVTTGASWKFTAPISGKYSVKYFVNNSGAVASASNIFIYKNGVQFKAIGFVGATASTITQSSGAGDVPLLAGDYIDVRSSNSYPAFGSSGSQTISSGIDINRIGN